MSSGKYIESIGTISGQPIDDQVNSIISSNQLNFDQSVKLLADGQLNSVQISSGQIVYDQAVKILTTQDFSSSLENAGYDLRSAEKVTLKAKTRMLIKTDLRMQMPNNIFFKVESRSGLALKGIDAKAGVIDSGYRNLIGVILHNYSENDLEIDVGMKIAQGIFMYAIHPKLIFLKDINEFDKSERNENGFGSTGMY